MRSIAARWALALTLLLAGATPSPALDLEGLIFCTWRDQGQDCTGPRCFNLRNTGERSFWIDFTNRSLCPHRDQLQCTEWIRLDVTQSEPTKKTFLLIAYRPDAALMYRVSESGKILGAIMAGTDRVSVIDGFCERR